MSKFGSPDRRELSERQSRDDGEIDVGNAPVLGGQQQEQHPGYQAVPEPPNAPRIAILAHLLKQSFWEEGNQGVLGGPGLVVIIVRVRVPDVYVNTAISFLLLYLARPAGQGFGNRHCKEVPAASASNLQGNWPGAARGRSSCS